MPEAIQYLLFVGFAGLMFLLRLDARRFGAAEWDTETGDWRVWLSRVTWYAAGLALGLVIFALHPSPASELNLVLAPDRDEALALGLVYGAGGIVAAFALALLRLGRLSFPSPGRYPGGVLAAVGTAFFDEFLFRGVLLGLLLSFDPPDWLAVTGAAVIYAGAIRASTGGRSLLTMIVAFAIGLVGGLLVLLTAGIAAAFVGHGITRFALFMTMGAVAVSEPGPSPRSDGALRATGDSRAWLIAPRGRPTRGKGDDGGGGVGPARPG